MWHAGVARCGRATRSPRVALPRPTTLLRRVSSKRAPVSAPCLRSNAHARASAHPPGATRWKQHGCSARRRALAATHIPHTHQLSNPSVAPSPPSPNQQSPPPSSSTPPRHANTLPPNPPPPHTPPSNPPPKERKLGEAALSGITSNMKNTVTGVKVFLHSQTTHFSHMSHTPPHLRIAFFFWSRVFLFLHPDNPFLPYVAHPFSPYLRI